MLLEMRGQQDVTAKPGGKRITVKLRKRNYDTKIKNILKSAAILPYAIS